LTFIILSHSSIGKSSAGERCWIPPQFTRISMGARFGNWKLVFTKFVTEERLLRSQVRISQAGLWGRERMAERVERMSRELGSRATRRISFAPAEARAMPIPRPMPLEAPVTMAVWPSRPNILPR